MPEEKPEQKVVKKPLFDKEETKWLLIGVLYVMLITISRIDLIGTALVVAGYFIGRGIEAHGLKLVEVNISREKV